MIGKDPPASFPPVDLWLNEHGNCIPDQNVFEDDDGDLDFHEHLDAFHDIRYQMFDTFDFGDRLRKETITTNGTKDSDNFEVEDMLARL
jgi:hypothetical protein